MNADLDDIRAELEEWISLSLGYDTPLSFVSLKGATSALVKVNGYVGRIIDIAESDTSLMVRVESAKCARRFQKPDGLDYTAAPDLWSPATLQDLLEDVEREKQAALKSIETVDKYVARVVAEAEAQQSAA